MKYFGLNPLKLEGYRFESGFGYSRHVNLKINRKKFIPVLVSHIVNWGIKEPLKLTQRDLRCKVVDKKEFLEFSVNTRNICCLTKICGCALFKFGESPWGPYSNLHLGQIKNWKSILIDVNWSFKAKGIADLVFDLWITKNKKGIPKETDMELMVWLDNNNLQPFGEYKGISDNFKIFYSSLESTRKFIPHQPCSTISYFYLSKQKEIKFDLLELIINSASYFGIKNINNYWIRTIDFGVEYGKNTKAVAKIFRLMYNFSSSTSLN